MWMEFDCTVKVVDAALWLHPRVHQQVPAAWISLPRKVPIVLDTQRTVPRPEPAIHRNITSISGPVPITFKVMPTPIQVRGLAATIMVITIATATTTTTTITTPDQRNRSIRRICRWPLYSVDVNMEGTTAISNLLLLPLPRSSHLEWWAWITKWQKVFELILRARYVYRVKIFWKVNLLFFSQHYKKNRILNFYKE